MTETTILATYGLLIMITILLQVLGGAQQLSIGYLLSSRDETRTLKRALDNSIVAMTLFAPAILILVLLDRTNSSTLLAAQVFLVARIVYVPMYAFGIPTLRTLAWLSGFAATAVLYFLAL